MQQIYKVRVIIDAEIEHALLFDNQNRAERFINALQQILTKKGRQTVKFIPELATLIDCDEDVIEAFNGIG